MKHFLRIATVFILASVLLNPGLPSRAQASDWGSITVGLDGNGRWQVTLDNSELQVRYGYFFEGHGQTAILDFVVKRTCGGSSANQDQVSSSGRYLDATSNRSVLTYAAVKYDGPDRKTVRLVWEDYPLTNPNAFAQDISIFPDSPHLQIDYLRYGTNIVEQGNPGGSGSGTYTFYGGDQWALDQTVPNTDPPLPRTYSNSLYPNSYYNRYDTSQGYNDPANGGSLSYDGSGGNPTDYFIGGIYGSNGLGFGRLMPVSATNISKLLFSRGFEWYAYFGQGHQSYRSFLFAIKCGADSIVPPPGQATSFGQDVANNANWAKYTLTTAVVGSGWVTKNPDTDLKWGDVVTVAAAAAPGWTFSGWSGALSGGANPAQLFMNNNKVITATFTQNPYPLTVNIVGNGIVTKTPDKPSYTNGEVVTLTAAAGPGWTFTDWSGDLTGNASSGAVTMTGSRIVTASFTLSDPDGVTPLNWWNGVWRFRLPIEVSANGYERFDKPAEATVNFTSLLTTLGANGTLDLNSLRVVEVDVQGNKVDDAIPFQFDPGAGFDATTNASGTLVFLLKGTTAANASRYFHVYFDTTSNGPFPLVTVAPQVLVADGLTHEAEYAFRIQTQNATYYYHKVGAAFASMDDKQGVDWIGYHPLLGAAGDFRGIPNMSDEVAHPGGSGASSTLVSQGPLKAVISSVSNDNQWELRWDIYPTYARMTLLERGANYWFLYEGTPFGKLDIGRDFYTLSTGLKTYMTSNSSGDWNADILDQEWAYFGDDAVNRVLYLAHHEDDTANDQFWQASGNMTVFGFGRQYKCCTAYLNAIPAHLTIGFADDQASAPQAINSAYRDLVVIAGQPVRLQTLDHAPVLAPIGDKLVQVGQTLNFTVSASDPDGDMLTLSVNNLPSGAAFDPGTGQFSWTPTLVDVGPHTVTFAASDGILTDLETITITVTALPVTGGNAVYLPLVVK